MEALSSSPNISVFLGSVKAAKYEIQKPSTCRTLFRCKFRLSPCVINLTRNKNICFGLKKCGAPIGWFVGQEQICYATSCEFDEKRATKPKFVAQSRPTLYFSQQLSWTRNKCFCCATSGSRRVKNGKHRQKLAAAKKQCCPTSWGFLCLVFRRLKRIQIERIF